MDAAETGISRSLDLAPHGRDHVRGIAADQPDGAERDDEDDSKHDGVLCNVLTLFVSPQVFDRVASRAFRITAARAFLVVDVVLWSRVTAASLAPLEGAKDGEQRIHALRVVHEPLVEEAVDDQSSGDRGKNVERHAPGVDAYSATHAVIGKQRGGNRQTQHHEGARESLNIHLESCEHGYLHSVASGTGAQCSWYSFAAIRKRLMFSSQNSSSSSSLGYQRVILNENGSSVLLWTPSATRTFSGTPPSSPSVTATHSPSTKWECSNL